MASLGIRPSSKPSGAPQAPTNEKIIKSTADGVPNKERNSTFPNTILGAFQGGHEYVIILKWLSTVQRRLRVCTLNVARFAKAGQLKGKITLC